MRVWVLSLNGELKGIRDNEKKAVGARRRHRASGLEGGRLAVLSIGQGVVP
jgi:hypothetical protein